ncbi:MAG: protein kinase, partial [Planctomycetota bacterium]
MSERELETLSGDARDERIGEILNEFLDQRARGEAGCEDELLRRHPQFADELRMHLDVLGDMQSRTDTIGTLIRQGLLDACADPRYAAELGAYKIIGMLGRGGMGIVLKAYEESLNRTVALKILRPELAGDLNIVRRFEREAKAAAALRHPNIVTVHAVGSERGTHFIAMEYINGPSLAQ